MIEVSVNLGASSAVAVNVLDVELSTTGLIGSIGTKYKFTTFVVVSLVSLLRSLKESSVTHFGRK